MQIFISYSKTREQVDTLVEDLEALGHEVWFDQELIGGQRWWDSILERIRNCDLFIFALSPASLASHPCELEYTYAGALKKRILPVMVEEVNTLLLPELLALIQYVDYRAMDRVAGLRLAHAINNLPATEPLPDPLPPPPPPPLSPLQKIAQRLQNDAPLTFDEQRDMLFELKLMLTGKDAKTARDLLEKLRTRRDVLAVIAPEIEGIFAPSARITPPPAQPDVPTVKVQEHEGNGGHSRHEAWTQQVLARLRGTNFEQFSSLPSVSGINIHAGYVRREHEFIVQVDTVVTLAMPIGELTKEMIRAYSESLLQHAPKAKKGFPGGWGRAFLIYPVLVAERFDDKLHNYILKEYLPGTLTTINTGGTEFPVLVELATGRVTVRQDRPNQRGGGFKQPHLEVVDLFKPE